MTETFLMKGDIIPSILCEYLFGFYITLIFIYGNSSGFTPYYNDNTWFTFLVLRSLDNTWLNSLVFTSSYKFLWCITLNNKF